MDKQSLYDFKTKIVRKVVDRLDFTSELTDEEVYICIDDVMTECDERRSFTVSEAVNLRKEVFYSLKGFDVLSEYLDDETVSEIMINGKDHIFVERSGTLYETGKSFESDEKLNDIIQQIVSGCNRAVNEAAPIADARLKTGERVNVVLNPVSLDGASVTIRRFPKEPITMEKLIAIGSITEEAAQFLKSLVISGYNLFISGGTGSGKTTFLNALSQYIPKDERIITIEDSAELRLLNAENIVRLETRNKSTEGGNEITIRDLIRTSLRMRPERIIVGEVRGAEALDMLQAMNTGHDGSLSTGHANSTRDMLYRLETMVIMGSEIPLPAVRRQVCTAIDVMVHLGRMRDKSRKVLEISEIVGMKEGEIELSKLFEFEEGVLVRRNNILHKYKLERTFGTGYAI